MFSNLSKWFSNILGTTSAFIIAFISVIIWLATGQFFAYSDTWQLVINSITNVVTFLMVFLIQNTQNRDATAIHLKLDEIIRSIKGAHNQLLNIENLSDEDLERLKKRYEIFAQKIKKEIDSGKSDTNNPEIFS